MVALLLADVGCQTKRETGAVVGAGGGAAIGGLVGGRGGALVGGLIGGIAGYGIGTAMDAEDRRRAAYALEQNRPIAWQNPETGAEYRFEPEETRYVAGRECRDYRMLAEVDGRPDEITGTACRRPDGSWENVSG